MDGTDVTINEDDKSDFVGGLARGLAVIESFDEENAQMLLSEVARRTGLAPASARRSLHTLVKLGYLKSFGKRFVLSPKILSLSSTYVRSVGIETVLQPEVQTLSEKFSDTAGVAVLVNRNIVYIAHYTSRGGMRPIAGVGATYPAYATSLGRILLSGLADREIKAYLAETPFSKLTTMTVVDPKQLKKSIDDARRLGYSTVVDQLFLGVTSLSVPIFNSEGSIVAALNTSTYSGERTAATLIKERLEYLQVTSSRITVLIGRHPALHHSLSRRPPFAEIET